MKERKTHNQLKSHEEKSTYINIGAVIMEGESGGIILSLTFGIITAFGSNTVH